MKSNKKNPRAISFSFHNSRPHAVDLSYSPGKGEEDQFFSTIEPDAEYSVTTYSGHGWTIREHGNDVVVDRFIVPPKSKGVTSLDIV